MYLYITEKDDFRQVPEALTKLLGKYTYVMDFDITTREKLGREDINMVMDNLKKQGYHLQMPETIPESILPLNKH